MQGRSPVDSGGGTYEAAPHRCPLTLFECVLTTGVARAAGAGACPTDSDLSGTVCVDSSEASVRETTNAKLIAKIRAGTATLIDLISAGAQQRGVLGDGCGLECPGTGNGCARCVQPRPFRALCRRDSSRGSRQSAGQRVAAARNSGKRLAASAEWQAAALGTPDPGASDWLDGLQRAESAGARRDGLAQWMRLRRERLRYGRKPLGMGCGHGTPRDGLRAFRVSPRRPISTAPQGRTRLPVTERCCGAARGMGRWRRLRDD